MNDCDAIGWGPCPEEDSDPEGVPEDGRDGPLRIGLDIGSTTVKLVAVGNAAGMHGWNPLFARYRRHNSCGWKVAAELLREFAEESSGLCGREFSLAVTGSGGISVSEELGLTFVQEVAAAGESVRLLEPDADVVIELGGEDAKILFLTGGAEQRMNETCAGGTGAFIDRMAAFLDTDAAGLDRLAAGASAIYPIASRCGVFAKADVLPLLNEGCSREDIAASIFQAVVEQTVSGLACGRRIEGKVVFLGGPLSFLPRLRRRFCESLHLAEGMGVLPEGSPYFVALGAAVLAPAPSGKEAGSLSLPEALERAASALEGFTPPDSAGTLPPLFRSRDEYEEFRARHAAASAGRAEAGGIGSGESAVPVWLGVDAGSTTIKSVLIDGRGRILHETYGPSRGSTPEQAAAVLREAYRSMPGNAYIAGAFATGYGAALLRAAFRFDADEVETVAHARAACLFDPKATFVLDIGGQDMKCLRLRDGVIVDLQLNEACSSGCGSFIETFAQSLGMDIGEFVGKALFAESPAELGTRCTVFMNSKVKQAQKEGRTAADIAAGLCYSVIRNALYKVIRVGSPEELGGRIVVQGGAFRNDALLRALELLTGRDVVRPDIAGLMGAYGAALLARDASMEGASPELPAKSALAGPEELESFSAESGTKRCPGCSNRCLLTVSRFPGGRVFVSGNRCERGEALAAADSGRSEPSGGARRRRAPDLAAEKYARLFGPYVPPPRGSAPRGDLGIPRALNIYENYPFWFTLLTGLGFRVVLSPPSGKMLFSSGMDTIPSQTVCYPAKLCHGHVAKLAEMGVKRIFFPCVLFERKEFPEQANRFNCPVVTGYPELIRNNIGMLRERGIEMICPVLSMDGDVIRRELSRQECFGGIPDEVWKRALSAAHAEQERFRRDMEGRALEILAGLARSGGRAVVLAGHPYHIDPEIGRGISALIAEEGIAVLTEDSVARLAEPEVPLRVVNQWTYHARLYRAAQAVLLSGRPVAGGSPLRPLTEKGMHWPPMALLQVVSFGCGLDAVTSDQVHDILSQGGIPSSTVKLDEGANMGSARIRIRSLAATMRVKAADAGRSSSLSGGTAGGGAGTHSGCGSDEDGPCMRKADAWEPPAFTGEMKETHTILIPQMAPYQFRFLPAMLRGCGYRAELLPSVSAEARETGLRFVNNDVCFPAVTVIGQLLEEVASGRRKGEKVALIISQTGGACRATNYISFLRRGMEAAGLDDIPLLSFNYAGMSRNPGFRIDAGMTVRGLMALLCGDLLMRLVLRTRPYELEKGAAERLSDRWAEAFEKDVHDCSPLRMWMHAASAVREFDRLPLLPEEGRRVRVGLVGEILLKYHPGANNDAVGVIEAEGGEAVVSGMADFVLYALVNDAYRSGRFGGGMRRAAVCRALMGFVRCMRAPLAWALRRSRRFEAPASLSQLRRGARGIVSEGQQAGEGWLLTAEMAELLESGVANILCLQPFGCLPNHITGKGVIRELRRRYPGANIAFVDYDAGVSEVNQLNRIRLMMACARRA